MACSGPGATNPVTAIADARLDSIPLICITGGAVLDDRHRCVPEVDTYGISIPITKHNYLVRDISELPQVISDAFRIAQSGRPGPVWIDIPGMSRPQRSRSTFCRSRASVPRAGVQR